MKKYNKEDLVNKIIRLRTTDGYTVHMIIEYIKSTGLSQRTAYKLIEASNDKVSSINEKTIKKSLDDVLDRFEEQYYNAIKDGDKKEAREVLKEIAKLKGLYNEKINISGNIEHNIDVIKLISIKKDDEDGIED